jgi:hypothetical protein
VARASTTVLLWTCVVLLAAAFGERLAPSVLGGVWPGCLTQTLVTVQRPLLLPADERVAVHTAISTTAAANANAVALPPKSKLDASCSFPPLSFPYSLKEYLRIRRLPFLALPRNISASINAFPFPFVAFHARYQLS